MGSDTISVMPTPTAVVPPTQRRNHRRRRLFQDVDQPWGVGSWPEAKRFKIIDDCVSEEEEIVAECLLMLARSGGGFCLSSSSTEANSSSVAGSMEGNHQSVAGNMEAHHQSVAGNMEGNHQSVAGNMEANHQSVAGNMEANHQSVAAIDTKKDQEPSYSADPATITASSSVAGGSTTTTTPTSVHPSAPKNYFTCNICGKICPSHQALGGHKTSHRPKPETTTLSSANSRRNAAPSGRIHQCAICQKIFPTGQALGGHMRKHYEGTTSGGASSHVTVSVVRNFDLNLPPPPEFGTEDESA